MKAIIPGSQHENLISLKQLAKLINEIHWQKEYNTIRKRAARGKYKTYIKIKGEGYVSIDDPEVPVNIKAKFHPAVSARSSSSPDSSGHIETTGNELSPRQYQFAIAAAKLINMFIEYSGLPENKGNKTNAQHKFVNAYNNKAWEDIFKIIGQRNIQTIRKWRTKYINSGKDYRALAPQYPVKKQSCVTPEESKVLIRLHLNPLRKPLVSETVHMAIDFFVAKRFPHIRSYTTYCRFLNQWIKDNYADYIFYREGEKGLDDKVLPYLERDYDKVEVGDIIVMDGHVNNYEIINPLTGLPKRMITVGAMDFKSQYLAGYEIAITENTLSIASALRRAILNLGKIPKIVYIDNGKAFKAKYFHESDIDNLEPLFARLGIDTIFAKAYHPQGKPIEPFWDWMAELERIIPTYVGTSIENKPARMNRGEKIHTKLYQKAMQGTTIDIWTAHKAMGWWLDKYHNREKISGHLKGLTPAEVFNEGRGPGVNKKELIFLMMQMNIATLYRKGIRLFSTWFWNESLFGKKLGPGSELLIRYDLLDRDSIFVYDLAGEFICEAKDVEKVHPAAGLLGNEEDIKKLHEQLAIKEKLKSSITGEAKQFIQEEIFPDIKRQLQDANILSLPEHSDNPESENEEAPPSAKASEGKGRKKKKSITDLWNNPGQKKVRNIDLTSKAAEG